MLSALSLPFFLSLSLSLFISNIYTEEKSVRVGQRYLVSSMKSFTSNTTALHCRARDDDNVTKANLATLKVVWGDNHISVSARRSSYVACCHLRNHIKLCVLPPLLSEISKNISQVIFLPCPFYSQLRDVWNKNSKQSFLWLFWGNKPLYNSLYLEDSQGLNIVQVVTGAGCGRLHPPRLLLPHILPPPSVPGVLQDLLPPHCSHHFTTGPGQRVHIK